MRLSLSVGDLVPRLDLRSASGEVHDVHSDRLAGQYQLYLLGEKAALELENAQHSLRELPVFIWAVEGRGEGSLSAGDDQTRTLLFGPGGGAHYLLIGPNLHVAAKGEITDAVANLQSLRALIERAVQRRASLRDYFSHPPVLMVPDVLSPSECAHLIEIYQTRGQEFVEPGHNSLEGRTTDCKMKVPDYGRSDRIDHWVCSEETTRYINNRVVPRAFPEILKAYNYKVTAHERYRIAQYEGARGGIEIGHRDNASQLSSHRRFAMTINLNAEDYQGGEVRFPEFSDHLYKGPSGSALIFSCSLLHEVAGMISGTRYALLAFLFGKS